MSSASRERRGRTWSLLALAALVAACGFAGYQESRAGDDLCCGGDPVTRPATRPTTRRVIRIAADPNNLPFSNEKLEGFENKIAALVAKDLNADLEYVWRAQRRGFFRHALKDAEADLVLGAPAGFDRALTTPPYYRSTYVFVARPGTEGAKVRSLDDPLLKWLKVGVQLIGDDGANTPPAHALAARGAVDNLVGFTVYGDYAEPNPPARIVSAVAKGDVDVAVVWGPLAGYFAGKQDVPLQLTPVSPEADAGGLRFTFSIAMGVQKPDKALRDELAGALERRRAEVGRILDEYHVPRLPSAARPASRPAEARDAK